MTTTDQLIDAFFDVAEAASHHHERVPWWLVSECVNHDDDQADSLQFLGLGLLTLHCVIAEWGVCCNVPQGSFPDPGRLDWLGKPPRRGKHYVDGTYGPDNEPNTDDDADYGGLSICHADSSFMRAIAKHFDDESWGAIGTTGFRVAMLRHRRSWNQLERSHGDGLLAWGTSLLLTAGGRLRREVHRWIVRRWLDEYWVPAVPSATLRIILARKNPPAPLAVMLHRSAVNAGIANSGKGWAKSWRSLTAKEQADLYLDAKARKSKRAKRRAEERMALCKRIPLLFEAAWVAPVGG